MNKLKKTGFLKAAGLMLAVMMPAAFAVSQTMAKYTSTGTVGGLTVSVAKWSILIGGESGEGGDDLVDGAVAELGSITWTVISLGEVTVPEEASTIVPGTWGYAAIEVYNASDVAADITITGFKTFLPTYKTAPTGANEYKNSGLTFKVYYSQDSDDTPTSFDKITDLCTSSNPSCSFTLQPDDSKSIYVCYKWTYRGTSDDPTVSENEEDTGMIGEGLTFGDLSVTAQQAKTAE